MIRTKYPFASYMFYISFLAEKVGLVFRGFQVLVHPYENEVFEKMANVVENWLWQIVKMNHFVLFKAGIK